MTTSFSFVKSQILTKNFDSFDKLLHRTSLKYLLLYIYFDEVTLRTISRNKSGELARASLGESWRCAYLCTGRYTTCDSAINQRISNNSFYTPTNRGGQDAEIPGALSLLLIQALLVPLAGSPQTGEPPGGDSDRTRVSASAV